MLDTVFEYDMLYFKTYLKCVYIIYRSAHLRMTFVFHVFHIDNTL